MIVTHETFFNQLKFAMHIICPICQTKFLFTPINGEEISVKCDNCYHTWDVDISATSDLQEENRKSGIEQESHINIKESAIQTHHRNKSELDKPTIETTKTPTQKSSMRRYYYIKLSLLIIAILAIMSFGFYKYKKYSYIANNIKIKDIKCIQSEDGNLVFKNQVQNTSNKNVNLYNLEISLIDSNNNIIDTKAYQINLSFTPYHCMHCSTIYQISKTKLSFAKIEIRCR